MTRAQLATLVTGLCACLCMGLAATACDSQATASDPRAAALRGDQQSREHETCAASAQCATGLRCFDHVCRRTDRSVLGDYAAALAVRARAKGEADAAIAFYGDALARYEADSLTVPADLECAYGNTLAASRSNKERAELAARVLHRCLVAAPAGSALHDQAMRDLADLYDSGLDPVHLTRTAPADLYLTRAPSRPDAAGLKLSATAEPMPTGKTFPTLLARLGEPDVRTAIVACWEAYFAATKKPGFAVQVPVRGKLIESEYDDEPARMVVALEGSAPTGNTPEVAALGCVRAALEPVFKDVKTVREPFQTTITFRLQ